jgi:hypothetical protein
VWRRVGIARELQVGARGGTITFIVEDRSHSSVRYERTTVSYSSVVIHDIVTDLAREAAEVVAVSVDMPQCPGRVSAHLRPETFNIATAIRILWWTAHWYLRVSNDSAAVQTGWATGSSVVAALVETCLA